MPKEFVHSMPPASQENSNRRNTKNLDLNAPIPTADDVARRRAELEASTEEDKQRTESLRKGIQKQKKPQQLPKSVIYNPGEVMELGDEDIEYVDHAEEAKREQRVLQNQVAKLEAQIKQAESKLSVFDRLKRPFQLLSAEPSTGAYARIDFLKDQLKTVKIELSMFDDSQNLTQEDQHMAKLRAEAKAEFKDKPPSFVKNPGQIARDMGRDSASTLLPGVRDSIEQDDFRTQNREGISLSDRDFTNPEEFDASLERDPAAAEQQRKDMQKANRDRLKQTAKAREQATPEYSGLRKNTGRRGADLRLATTEEIADRVATKEMADRKEPMTTAEREALHKEFNEARRGSKDVAALDVAEAQDAVMREQKKLGWESHLEELDEPQEETPASSPEIRGLRKQTGRRGEDLRLRTTDEMSDALLSRSHAETKIANQDIAALGEEFRSKRRVSAERAMTPKEIEAKVKEARKENKWENDDAIELDSSDFEVIEPTVAKVELPKGVKEAAKKGRETMNLEPKMTIEQTVQSIGQAKASRLWENFSLALKANQEDIKAMKHVDYLDLKAAENMLNARYNLSPGEGIPTKLTFAITELTKTQNPALEASVMKILNAMKIEKQQVLNVLYPPSEYPRAQAPAEKQWEDIVQIKADDRGTAKTVAAINKGSSRARIGGSTATGGLTGR